MLTKKFYRYHFLRAVRQKGTSQNLALSSAIGVFIGFFVPLGGQMALAFIIAWLFKLNKILMVSSVWVTNPITIFPIYLFYFYIGSKITGIDVLLYIEQIKNNSINFDLFVNFGKDGLQIFFLGALISAIVGSIIAYFIVFIGINKYREKKE